MTDRTSPPVPRARGWRRVRRSPVTHVIAAFIVLALVQLFLVKPFQVPSESMSPTLETGDRIVADRISLAVSDPAQGDVVVFSRPDGWKTDAAPRGALRTAAGWVGDLVGFGPSNLDALVKRVVGTPGSTVRCCSTEGQVEVDEVALDEDYVRNDLPFIAGQLDCESAPTSSRCFGPIDVPEGHYLVMGDNRANSADSVVGCRGAPASTDCARFVDRADMIGEVRAIVWPLDRAFGPLD
ncbi:signal peptidase I [Microbacterium sp. KSW4-17]|uniref:Signal peptidase I n=1 Tax=Microbacterium galbum TaxID=3075994 RepID=A0ABU3T4T7_9MICO|nr:signal peptidase I [Microbacterium sp. KSW4-17]MDU0366381.1 signal peptidase I [Microbacterium sp. KSW4-17]